MMKIPLYQPSLNKREEEAALNVIRSGKLSRGLEVDLFEKEFADFVGKEYAVAVNSGTSALHLSVKVLGWKKGDEVITTPYSFIATSNVLLYEGVTPVFVDIDPKTLNLNPQDVIRRVSKRTVGILPVHIWGFPIDVDEINKIKKQCKLTIIEDASQAIGKPSDAFPVARVGEISVYSFFENKQMTTGGEGGIIVTDNQDLAEICKSLRDQGRSSEKKWLDHVRLGYNYRMTEIQAAIGRIQLQKLPDFLERREILASKYTELFRDCPILSTPFESGKYKRSWFLYYLVFESSELRNEVQKHLANKGIECKMFFPPIPSFYEFKERGYDPNDYPIAKSVYEKSLALPLFSSMKEEEVAFISEEIRSVVEK